MPVVWSYAPRDTERAGAALAATLAPGDVVRLSGTLGAGKTTFVRGALKRLGVKAPASSPTYVLAHEAWGKTAKGERVRVAHLDFYRLDVSAEARGLMDYLDGRTIVFVEWPEQDPGFRAPPRQSRSVRILRRMNGTRQIMLSAPRSG